MPEKNRKEFTQRRDTDFAYEIPGLARFRGNAFFDRNGPGGVFRRIHAPMLKGSILTAALLVFVDVMKELPATLMLRPFNFDTLAIHAYEYAADEQLKLAAPGALAIVVPRHPEKGAAMRTAMVADDVIVKRRGAERPTVLPCTLIAYDPAFEMGTTLADAAKADGGMFNAGAVKLCHPHCAKFCVLGGGSCSAR